MTLMKPVRQSTQAIRMTAILRFIKLLRILSQNLAACFLINLHTQHFPDTIDLVVCQLQKLRYTGDGILLSLPMKMPWKGSRGKTREGFPLRGSLRRRRLMRWKWLHRGLCRTPHPALRRHLPLKGKAFQTAPSSGSFTPPCQWRKLAVRRRLAKQAMRTQ